MWRDYPKDYVEEAWKNSKRKIDFMEKIDITNRDYRACKRAVKFFDLKDEDMQTIYEALISADKDISYLDEKLQITKNSNVKNVTGFIIKAIKDNYTPNNKTNNIQFKSKYKTGAGAGVNETFRQYDPDELEKLLRESQKGKF